MSSKYAKVIEKMAALTEGSVLTIRQSMVKGRGSDPIPSSVFMNRLNQAIIRADLQPPKGTKFWKRAMPSGSIKVTVVRGG